MLKQYLIAFTISFIVACVLTPIVRRISLRLKWLDKPNWRKVNRKPMPLCGGLAIYAGFVASILFLYLKGLANFDPDKLFGLLGSSFIIVLVGLEDDTRGLTPRRKLFYQVVAATIVCLYGFNITRMSLPFSEPVELPLWLGMIVTVFWIVGFTNAINLLDGLDGLAAGVVSIISGTLFFTALTSDSPLAAVRAIALMGATLGFLPYNFYPAKIFMGDTGSMLLGFIIALTSLEGSFKGTTFITLFVPIIAMGVPVIDTLLAILRRLVKGNGFETVFKADKEHVHHKLLTQEGTQRKAVLKLYFLTLCFGLIAAGLSGLHGAWAIFGVILTILATMRWLLHFELVDFVIKEGNEGR